MDHAVTKNAHNERAGNVMNISVNVNTRGLAPSAGTTRSAKVPPPRFGVLLGGALDEGAKNSGRWPKGGGMENTNAIKMAEYQQQVALHNRRVRQEEQRRQRDIDIMMSKDASGFRGGGGGGGGGGGAAGGFGFGGSLLRDHLDQGKVGGGGAKMDFYDTTSPLQQQGLGAIREMDEHVGSEYDEYEPARR